MIQDGQIVLFAFPQTDQATGKLHPALVLRRSPGAYDDWLICMISSQLHHEISGTDEVIRSTDVDFAKTGLKGTSLIRVTRLAIVSADLLHGTIGSFDNNRLERVRMRIAQWICGSSLPISQGKIAEAKPDT